jgi:hypothetical protein
VLVGHRVRDDAFGDSAKYGVARGVIPMMVRVDDELDWPGGSCTKPIEQRACLSRVLRVYDHNRA